MAVLPLRRRPLDMLLVVFYTVSVVYGLLFSLPEALGVAVAADSWWPPLRWLAGWATSEEAGHLQHPLPIYLASASAIDGLVHSPFLLVMLYAIVRGRNWIRLWALLFAGSSVTNMYYYFMHTFLGEHPPPNTIFYLVFNLPWMLMPVLLAWRMWRPRPFDSPTAAR